MANRCRHPNGVKMCLFLKLPPDVLAYFKEQGAKGPPGAGNQDTGPARRPSEEG